MATKLEKTVARETTVKRNEREIQIILGQNQTINLKLKGMKSGVLSIGIGELYDMLSNEVVKEKEQSNKEKPNEPIEITKTPNNKKDGGLVNLNDLRSHFITSKLPYDIKVMIDSTILSFVK